METNTFGVQILESVINGNHYDRSLRGFLIIEDALESMKWKAFWATSGKSLEHHKTALEAFSYSFEQNDSTKQPSNGIIKSSSTSLLQLSQRWINSYQYAPMHRKCVSTGMVLSETLDT